MWDILKERCPKVKVVDIGAGEMKDKKCPCAKLKKIDACEITGFEPNDKTGKFLPYIIADGQRHNFRICNYTLTSSLYEPNLPLLEKFQYLADLMKPARMIEVETKKLDDVVTDCDLIKIDTQGSEYEILKGATETLEKAVIIQLEVIFLPMYLNQPRFAQIDGFLQDAGFLFHNFNGAGGRAFKPLIIDKNNCKPLNQILWADAIYVKSFMDFPKLPTEKLLKLAIILHEAYGSFDLANYALMEYDKRNNTNLSDEYLRKI